MPGTVSDSYEARVGLARYKEDYEGGYDDVCTFARVMYEIAWKYDGADAGERILEYFESPHKWANEYRQWVALGGTLEKDCMDAFENWLEHKDDPAEEDNDE